MGRLSGKVAIVTGAGQGIGRGIALAFAKEGAKVVISEINPKTAQAVAAEIQAMGEKALAIVCDGGHNDQVKAVVDQTIKEFGALDIVVNVAQGFGAPGAQRAATLNYMPLEDFPEDWWDHSFQTGVKASLFFCQAAFPYLKERGGKIINFGSRDGIIGKEGAAAYNATKEAIRALTRTAAREWGKYKINVNVICPASSSGPAFQAFAKDHPEVITETLQKIPLGRFGDPEKDIGRVAVFLASEDSDFITGHTFTVDGGLCMYA